MAAVPAVYRPHVEPPLAEGRGAAALRRLLPALLVLTAFTTPAVAREEIRTFDSVVTVCRDGTIDVVERLAVNVEGEQIKHGIFRDIVTSWPGSNNVPVDATLSVIEVLKNGEAEPSLASDEGNRTMRVRIGAADVLLAPGLYTYVLHYSMTGAAQHFAGHDDLLWNVTGDAWAFPILSASATIVLPAGSMLTSTASLAGAPGLGVQQVRVERISDTEVRFVTTGELDVMGSAARGLTVAVQYTPGAPADGSAPAETCAR